MKLKGELGVIIASMLEKIPKVLVKMKLNSTNFTVAKKVFAFTKGDSVVMKLPQETIHHLLKTKSVKRLIMGKRVMKEWVVKTYKTPNECKKDLNLFLEAMKFVSKL